LLYRLLCCLVGVLARGGGERELEIVVLRHQLAILRRGGKRPQYTTADQAFLAAVSRPLPARAMVLLCGQSADAPPLAPGTALGEVGDAAGAGPAVRRSRPRRAA
jgi:hypothetical protein